MRKADCHVIKMYNCHCQVRAYNNARVKRIKNDQMSQDFVCQSANHTKPQVQLGYNTTIVYLVYVCFIYLNFKCVVA